jgi:hypothetical protein
MPRPEFLRWGVDIQQDEGGADKTRLFFEIYKKNAAGAYSTGASSY